MDDLTKPYKFLKSMDDKYRVRIMIPVYLTVHEIAAYLTCLGKRQEAKRDSFLCLVHYIRGEIGRAIEADIQDKSRSMDSVTFRRIVDTIEQRFRVWDEEQQDESDS